MLKDSFNLTLLSNEEKAPDEQPPEKDVKNSPDLAWMIGQLSKKIKEFPDRRTGSNISRSLKDAALGAFSIFFLQSPSFLSHQQVMKTNRGKNNARSLFGIEEILSESHIRNLLDVVNPAILNGVYYHIIERLKREGYLELYESERQNYLISLDGTQYFSSKKISCDRCSRRKVVEKDKEKTNHFHCVVAPVLVQAGINRVISLPPEFITPQDGNDKQDCECTASKRWIKTHHSFLSRLGHVTILGDDLYSHQPFCQELLDGGYNFILVCKPNSHQTLYEYVAMMEEEIERNRVRVKRIHGKDIQWDNYRFYNGLPLKDGEKEVMEVNWCEVVTTSETGAVLYCNSWVSNLKITAANVVKIVQAGRARWKVENENHNVLKNNGYHLEHNFGHGAQYLSSLLISLNILAFLFHTVLEMFDQKYVLIRKKLKKRSMFFDHLEVLTCYWFFNSWDEMLDFMIEKLELNGLDST